MCSCVAQTWHMVRWKLAWLQLMTTSLLHAAGVSCCSCKTFHKIIWCFFPNYMNTLRAFFLRCVIGTLLLLWQCVCFYQCKRHEWWQRHRSRLRSPDNVYIYTHCVLNVLEEKQTTKATSITHSTISPLCINSVSLQSAKMKPTFHLSLCSVFMKMFLLYLVGMFLGILMHVRTHNLPIVMSQREWFPRWYPSRTTNDAPCLV